MFLYIIECEDGSLYTGIAKDIEKRLCEHYNKLKTCAKYTKSHQMKNLKALWKCSSKITASRLEYHIKKLSRTQKLELIKNPKELETLFFDKINTNEYEYIDSKNQQIIMQKIIHEE